MKCLACALALAAGVGLASLAGAEEKPDPAVEKERKDQHEEAVKKALDDFKKAFKEAKTPSDRAAAVKWLGGEELDAKLIAELSRLLPDIDEVRSEAMAALGKYRGSDAAAQALLRVMPLNVKSTSLMEKNIAALGGVAHPASLPALVKCLREKEVLVAAAAVKALGGIVSPVSVDALITVWDELERDKKKEGEVKTKAEGRIAVLGPVLKASLLRLTGQKGFFFVEQYKEWWVKNRGTFKPKDEPPAVCQHFAPPGATAKAPEDGGTPAAAPAAAPAPAGAAYLPKIDGVFYRAVNLNGPPLPIDGNSWESGTGAPRFSVKGSPVENRSGPLIPPTDESRARMLRTALAGADALTLTFSEVPPGNYLVCIYVWEGSGTPKMFDVHLQGKVAVSNFSTGQSGQWQRFGPWTALVVSDGLLTFACSGGAVNVCGIEVWKKE